MRQSTTRVDRTRTRTSIGRGRERGTRQDRSEDRKVRTEWMVSEIVCNGSDETSVGGFVWFRRDVINDVVSNTFRACASQRVQFPRTNKTAIIITLIIITTRHQSTP
jgi:hypothetical protein